MSNAGKSGIYTTHYWKVTLRKQVLERDGYRCRKCRRLGKQKGGPVTLSMQHKIPERVLQALGRVPTVGDVVTLCLQCHGHEDGGRRYR